MASSLEHVFTCQVCFEEFEETGDHVPRLLPCTHTLCETCVGQLIRGDTLQCPECRQKHRATRKEKSFSQNKYILVNIKRSTSTNGQTISSKQPQADLCERQNRPRDLFCTEELCQRRICPLCLKDEHRNHNFEDAEQVLEYKQPLKHLPKISFRPKKQPLKRVKDASQLKFEGKEQLQTFETNLAVELGRKKMQFISKSEEIE